MQASRMDKCQGDTGEGRKHGAREGGTHREGRDTRREDTPGEGRKRCKF